VADVFPPATVTLDGVTALGSLDERVTAVPPGGEAIVKVTVPVELDPPATGFGETERLAGTGG